MHGAWGKNIRIFYDCVVIFCQRMYLYKKKIYIYVQASRLKLRFGATACQTNKTTCAPSEDRSDWASRRIRVFAVCVEKTWVLSYPLSAQRRLIRLGWADAQADLSLRWAQGSVCWFCHAVAHIYDTAMFYEKLWGMFFGIVGNI